MSTKVADYLAEQIVWGKNADPLLPYTTEFEGERCLIRLNDFPEEHLYTLIVNGGETTAFDDWPARWVRP